MTPERPALARLRAEDSLLVCIDVQTRLTQAMPAARLAQCLDTLGGQLLPAAERLEIPVVVTRQYPKGLGELHPELAPHIPASTPQQDKTCFSCWGDPGFRTTLEGAGDRAQILLTGIETHVCVLQTALDLRAAGYSVFVVENAVCARHEAAEANALERLRHAGVTIVWGESVLFEWLGDARHEAFKAIAPLLKDDGSK
jgi:nicotinamidase-related amidase